MSESISRPYTVIFSNKMETEIQCRDDLEARRIAKYLPMVVLVRDTARGNVVWRKPRVESRNVNEATHQG